jgi:hypothetical protein
LDGEPVSNVSFLDDSFVLDLKSKDPKRSIPCEKMLLNLALNHTVIIETNSTKECKVRGSKKMAED